MLPTMCGPRSSPPSVRQPHQSQQTASDCELIPLRRRNHKILPGGQEPWEIRACGESWNPWQDEFTTRQGNGEWSWSSDGDLYLQRVVHPKCLRIWIETRRGCNQILQVIPGCGFIR